MKLKTEVAVNDKTYPTGANLPWYFIYPFFMFHMLAFGGSGFFMAYAEKEPSIGFLYLHGGFAIFVYTIFYLALFGVDEVKWMFINAGLGLFGIYSQIGWMLALFGKNVDDYPYYVHVIPFLYYILYTFLLRHALLDMLGARKDTSKRKTVEFAYVAVSLAVYGGTFLLERV